LASILVPVPCNTTIWTISSSQVQRVGPALEDPNRHVSIGTDAGATTTPKPFSTTISTFAVTRHPTTALFYP
jgi:hypothetical protein